MLPNYRRCVSCHKIAPKQEFWRIVRLAGSSKQIELDQGMGRSAYICRCLDCLKNAKNKNRLGRTLKAQISEEIFKILSDRLKSNGN